MLYLNIFATILFVLLVVYLYTSFVKIFKDVNKILLDVDVKVKEFDSVLILLKKELDTQTPETPVIDNPTTDNTETKNENTDFDVVVESKVKSKSSSKKEDFQQKSK